MFTIYEAIAHLKYFILQNMPESNCVVKVDIHEGCSRACVPPLVMLVDSKTLKAVVEHRSILCEMDTSVNSYCRFCGVICCKEESGICSNKQCQVNC